MNTASQVRERVGGRDSMDANGGRETEGGKTDENISAKLNASVEYMNIEGGGRQEENMKCVYCKTSWA